MPFQRTNVLLGVLSTKFILQKTFLVIKEKFTLMYPKHLKVAMVTTKTSLIQRLKKDTELSKQYWKVKLQDGIPIINWEVLRKCHAYNQKKRQSVFWLSEKYEIAKYKGDNF